VEGKIFTTTWGDQSYEISVMIDRENCKYEVRLNQELLKKGLLNWFKYCYWFPIEKDGHYFLAVIHKTKTLNEFKATCTEYQFDCFADSISVSDGITTFKAYYQRLKRDSKKLISKKVLLKSVIESLIRGALVFALTMLFLKYDVRTSALTAIVLVLFYCWVYILIPLTYRKLELSSLRRFFKQMDSTFESNQ